MNGKRRVLLFLLIAALLLPAALTSCRKTVKEPAGHHMGVWSVETRPTYKKNGKVVRRCEEPGCSYSETHKLKASKGLSYAEDDGLLLVSGAGSCRDGFLYIAAETPDGRKVDGIAPGAFTDSDLPKYVVIEEGVRQIGGYAFSGCQHLVSAALPKNVDVTEAGIFLSCSSLAAVRLPENLKILPESCFDGCTALRSVALPEGVETLEHAAFNLCESLETLELPESLTAIGSGCFDSCFALRTLSLPKGLRQIGSSAFAQCRSLTALTLDMPLSELGAGTFSGCRNLKRVFLSRDIDSIAVRDGVSPFYGAPEDLVILTDAIVKPDGWADHFPSYDSERTASGFNYSDLKVVYGIAVPEENAL